MFYLGGMLSGVLDAADNAVSSVLGGLSSAGAWMQSNPGAATLLGSALVAGGSYMENRETQKTQKRMRDDEWAREDRIRDENGVPQLTPIEYQVTPGLAGDGMTMGGSLTNGLLANIQKNKKGSN